MKLKMWKTIGMAILPLSLAVTLPVVLTSCGSTTEPVNENKDNFKPSDSISEKFTYEAFKKVEKGIAAKIRIQNNGTLQSVKIEDDLFEIKVSANNSTTIERVKLTASSVRAESEAKFLHEKSIDNGTNWITNYLSASQLELYFNSLVELSEVGNVSEYYRPSDWLKEKISLETFNILSTGFAKDENLKPVKDVIVKLNGDIFEVYFPANSNGFRSVYWFDLLSPSTGANKGKIHFKSSSDGGATWDEDLYRDLSNIINLFQPVYYMYGLSNPDFDGDDQFYLPSETFKSLISFADYRVLVLGYSKCAYQTNKGLVNYFKLVDDVIYGDKTEDVNRTIEKIHLTKETSGEQAGKFKIEESFDLGATWTVKYISGEELTSMVQQFYYAGLIN